LFPSFDDATVVHLFGTPLASAAVINSARQIVWRRQERAMANSMLEKRVESLEKQMERLTDVPERLERVEGRLERVEGRLERVEGGLRDVRADLTAFRGEFLQFRQETRGEFLAIRTELRAEMQSLHENLIRRMDAGDDATRVFMRVLHEELKTEIKLVGEGRKRRKRS